MLVHMDSVRDSDIILRALTPHDAPAVHALMVATELADLGERLIELEDIESDWRKPSFRIAEQTAGLFRGEELVAYAELDRSRADAYVHPDHRGRGLGLAVVEWTEVAAHRLGFDRIGQTVPTTNTTAISLFTERGYDALWTSWILELADGAQVAPHLLPSRFRMRQLRAGPDEHDAYRTIEDAFNEWPNREAMTFEDWRAGTLGRSDHEPWHLQLIVEDTGDASGAEAIVGVCHLGIFKGDGWVDEIAVRRDRRGLGLGRALLAHSFELARDHGAQRSRLATDSRTGALGLYEHVGMRISQTFTHYSREVSA